MFVRSGETDMDKTKSVLEGNDTWIQKLISTSVAKNISDFNKLSNCYLTKSARLQAFNHGYNVIPAYLEANPNINKRSKTINKVGSIACVKIPALENVKVPVFKQVMIIAGNAKPIDVVKRNVKYFLPPPRASAS